MAINNISELNSAQVSAIKGMSDEDLKEFRSLGIVSDDVIDSILNPGTKFKAFGKFAEFETLGKDSPSVDQPVYSGRPDSERVCRYLRFNVEDKKVYFGTKPLTDDEKAQNAKIKDTYPTFIESKRIEWEESSPLLTRSGGRPFAYGKDTQYTWIVDNGASADVYALPYFGKGKYPKEIDKKYQDIVVRYYDSKSREEFIAEIDSAAKIGTVFRKDYSASGWRTLRNSAHKTWYTESPSED